MPTFYSITCGVTLATCAVLAFVTRPKADANTPESFRKLQIKYLVAWAICVAADWLQGPYVYALYQSYGYSRADNAKLFVAGFGASFLFGTFVAGFADSIGRKRAILLYCSLYVVSCLTKHVNEFNMLLIGRVTGGIATSLLFSAFESWLASESTARHSFPQGLISYAFSMMYFVNYLVAAGTGLFSDKMVDAVDMKTISGPFHAGSFLMAFDAAIVCCIVGGIYVAVSWEENYGDSEGMMAQLWSFKKGVSMICTNLKLAMCCGIVALFESSMYIFVFNWTPVLHHDGGAAPPFGMIFSTFMMSCMIGSSIFALCNHYKTKLVLFAAISVACCAMMLPAYLGMSANKDPFNFLAFLIFEVCCGLYFPAIGTLKADAVPEANRSTIYNLFRAPMNMIVVAVLLINPPLEATFKLVALQLLIATLLLGGMLMSERRVITEEHQPLVKSA
eukprot:TRINITY_DN26904_c0_g1_i1.p1 TRINITY_DN26904_c0_g1~~TRINITY_DN26904_c0_g1_i1.p1  ORF type:complete len:448 (-),score=74.92 TRINITY_DN26904_c0_g1_i1:28-1371(-)